MFTTIESFLAAWKHEANGTQRLLDALTDESLKQAVTQDHRTLGRLAWHITTSIHEMMSRTGLQFDAPGEEATEVPSSAQTIADTFRAANDAFIKAIKEQWTDATLQEEHNLYGETWKNGFTLNVLILHMVHHRGQMTVLMRQAGLKVPGIYGPALEEWSQFGAPAPIV